MKRRNFILLLGGASSGAMSVGTGAFSSVKAERGVEVNVVDDEEAFVGYHTPEAGGTVENGDRITLVEIRNRFSEETPISLVGAQIVQGGDILAPGSYEVERRIDTTDPPKYEPVDHADVVESPAEPDTSTVPTEGFEPGLYERITAKVAGIGNEDVEIAVNIRVRGVVGTGVEAQLFGVGDTRAFTVTGSNSSGDSDTPVIDFTGNSGHARLSGVDSKSGIPTRVWYRDNSDTLQSKTESLSNGQIRNNLFDDGERENKRIVAVSLTEMNRTYIRTDDDLNPGNNKCYDGVPESEDKFDMETLSACD